MSDALTGNTISQLESAGALQDTDLFVISQRDEYIYSEFNSAAVTKKQLVGSLIAGIKRLRRFGTIASCDTGDFAPAQHNHDDMYNKLSVTALVED